MIRSWFSWLKTGTHAATLCDSNVCKRYSILQSVKLMGLSTLILYRYTKHATNVCDVFAQVHMPMDTPVDSRRGYGCLPIRQGLSLTLKLPV